jgi:NAD(P)-dependent dehydrogenase (short-subunit alcohol dehydrogenase family)
MSTYVVTGTSRGLGLEIVKYLTTLPTVSKIIATARSPRPSEALAEIIAKTADDKIIFVALDTTSNTSIPLAVSTISQLTASTGIDVLINNAGIISSMLPIESESPEELISMFTTNVAGTHAVTQAFLLLLRQGKGKKIVNISSEMGSIAKYGYYDYFPTPAYKVSKTALNGLSMLYAMSLGKEGFVVVPVNPGVSSNCLL